MNNSSYPQFTIIPVEVLTAITTKQEEILESIKHLQGNKKAEAVPPYITAKEYMESVRICRSKFDSLREKNLIKTLTKGRKIYVPVTEIERYFKDPSIQ
jgi:hypothetical protein